MLELKVSDFTCKKCGRTGLMRDQMRMHEPWQNDSVECRDCYNAMKKELYKRTHAPKIGRRWDAPRKPRTFVVTGQE